MGKNDVNYQLIKTNKLILSEVIEIDENITSKKISSQLAFKGINELQKQIKQGVWMTLTKCRKNSRTKKNCKISKNKYDKSVLITIKKHKNTPIRIISYKPEFKSLRKIGSSSGKINQIIKLPYKDIVKNSLKIQIRINVNGHFFYEDWTVVDNFKNSTANDRHYIFNSKNNTIAFGDNKFGKIPEKSVTPNIFIISCEVFARKHFNIKKDRTESMKVIRKRPFVLNNKAMLGVNTYVLKPRITVIDKSAIKGSYILMKEECKSRLGYTSRLNKNARLK